MDPLDIFKEEVSIEDRIMWFVWSLVLTEYWYCLAPGQAFSITFTLETNLALTLFINPLQSCDLIHHNLSPILLRKKRQRQKFFKFFAIPGLSGYKFLICWSSNNNIRSANMPRKFATEEILTIFQIITFSTLNFCKKHF